MNIFKKWKENIKRDWDKKKVLYYSYKYRNVYIKTPLILAGTIYIIKDSSYGLILVQTSSSFPL